MKHSDSIARNVELILNLSEHNHDEEKRHYVDISNDRLDSGFDQLDTAMEKIINETHLNFFEVLTILEMMATKVRRNNIDQYLLETVTRFQEMLNKEDEDGR